MIIASSLLTTILGLVVSLGFPEIAAACSCAEPDDVPTAFKKAVTVVVAEAVSVSREIGSLTSPDNKQYEVTFEVVEWLVTEKWKGAHGAGQRFRSRTVITCCICGRSVERGEVLLLYLADPEPYSLNACSRTASLKHALKDIPLLYHVAETEKY
jgi:hypothetical protein